MVIKVDNKKDMCNGLKILFICQGNTCRSPMAEVIFNHIAKDRGLTCHAESAGMSGASREHASDNIIEVLADIGIDISAHRSQKLTEEIFYRNDIIILLESSHEKLIKLLYKENKPVHIMHIPDPFGGDKNEYEQCRDKIISVVKFILDNLI